MARGRKGCGALAGFLAGIAWGILITIFAILGLALAGTLTEGGTVIGLVGGLEEVSVGIRALIFAIFEALASTIGGVIGALLAR